MKKRGSKLIAVLISFVVLGLLVISGPAQAYILGLVIDNNDVNKGEIIDFEGSVEIEYMEQLEIDYLILRLQGPENIECKFNVDGSIISGCLGITITQIGTAPNYGYGFEQGVLSYEFTLDTNYYSSGTYETSLGMMIEDEIFFEKGEDIIIRGGYGCFERCSIRAEDGQLDVDKMDFGNNNNINFYLSNENAVNGDGYLTGQRGRDRITYNFDTFDCVENTQEYSRISVSGRYKIGRYGWVNENSIIYFDKINNKISLTGKDVNLIDSDIYFREYC